MFIHRARAAIAVLLLLGSTMFTAAPIAGHTYSPTHYAAPCSPPGNNAYNVFFHVLRPVGFNANDHTTYGSYKSIQGTATITDLDPCTSASSTYKGWSMVNVVNGETMAYGANAYAFVQFGYAQQACVSGGCQGTFSPYVTDFWWTDADNTNGAIARADWVDFNDGGHDLPVVGDRYQFTITWLVSPALWSYCVKVISSSTYTVGSVDCNPVPQTRHTLGNVNRATWGAETFNDASAIGTTTGNDVNLSPMQYMNATGSIYTTVTGATCFRARLDGGVPWNSQGCAVTEYSGASHMVIWTAPHS